MAYHPGAARWSLTNAPPFRRTAGSSSWNLGRSAVAPRPLRSKHEQCVGAAAQHDRRAQDALQAPPEPCGGWTLAAPPAANRRPRCAPRSHQRPLPGALAPHRAACVPPRPPTRRAPRQGRRGSCPPGRRPARRSRRARCSCRARCRAWARKRARRGGAAAGERAARSCLRTRGARRGATRAAARRSGATAGRRRRASSARCRPRRRSRARERTRPWRWRPCPGGVLRSK